MFWDVSYHTIASNDKAARRKVSALNHHISHGYGQFENVIREAGVTKICSYTMKRLAENEVLLIDKMLPVKVKYDYSDRFRILVQPNTNR